MITSFDYYKQIESPDMYLCNPDQKLIGAINTLNRHVALRFNDLSELTFTVPKNINKENDYEMVATKRLIFIDKIGWFQIISVVENTEGEVVSKTVTAESHQTMFKNKGFVTEGRVYMFYNPNDPLDSRYDSSNVAAIPSVVGQLHQQLGIKVALNNSEITPTEDKVDWTITWIDPSLKFSAVSYNAMYEALEGASNICRSFEENTEQFGYDFIINNVEIAFGVVFEFDFLYHTISIKPLEEITKPTDIYLSFDNVMNSMSVSENSEDIVTVLTCSGSELDIRTVNPMGTNYICNFDYYAKRISDDGKIPYPWMSEELISALEDWKEEFEKWQTHDDARTNHTRSYSELTAELQRLYSEKLVFDEAITKSNLQLQTLFAARDQYLSKSSATKIEGEDGEEWIGSAPVIVETVDGETKSLLSTSGYYNAFFNGTANITGYKSQPNVVKRENKFAYDFSGIESKTGSANSLIAGYMQDLEENELAELENLYLYFTDDSSTESFCKLNVKSEVGVAKDVNENIVSFIQTAGEAWTAKTGTVELQGITFSISRTTATGAISVASGGSAIITFTSNSYFVYNNLRFYVTIGSDGIVSLYCFYVSGFDRYTTYTKLTGDSGWCSLWENYINNTLVTESDDYAEDIQAIQDEMAYINAQCNVQTYIKNKSQALYNELSNYWIEGSYNNDNLAVLDTTTMDERIELAKELMETAEQDLIRSSQPQFSLSVTAINFIKLIQFRGFTSQLELGRTITVEKTEDVLYAPALLSMEYDLDDVGSFSLTFSNAAKVDETMMTYAELLQETSSVSRTVSSNWLNLTEYARNKDSLKKLTEAPLDRTLRAAQRNMAAQAFIVDETGILGRKYDDDSHTSFLPEQIRIINNTILFTQDNWETAALALGKIQYGEGQEAYGLVADVLVGNLMLSSQMVITNGDDDNSILLNDTGILIKHEGENVFVADTSGNLEITGIIHATGGEIGALTINEDGSIVANYFSVTANGEVTATKGNIGALTINLDGSIFSQNEKFLVSSDGLLTASGANISGHIDAETGTIGAFTITSDGLDSEHIKLNSQSIFFPTQSVFNLSNDVTIYSEDTVSYIATSGNRDFEIKNIGGAGVRFKANPADETVYQAVNLTNIKLRCETYEEDLGEGYYSTDYYYYLDFNWSISNGGILLNPMSFTIYLRLTYDYPGTIFGIGAYTESRTVAINFDIPALTNSGSFSKDTGERGKSSYYTWHGVSKTNSTTNSNYSFSNISFENIAIQSTNNILYSLGSFCPNTTATSSSGYLLGDDSHVWRTVRAYTASITTSDRREKNDIKLLSDKHEEFFDGLNPVTFVYEHADSGRTHLGFIAQDVEEALLNAGLTTMEFAGVCIGNDENKTYGLRYEEFIALNTSQIQKLKSRVSELEKQIKELKGE